MALAAAYGGVGGGGVGGGVGGVGGGGVGVGGGVGGVGGVGGGVGGDAICFGRIFRPFQRGLDRLTRALVLGVAILVVPEHSFGTLRCPLDGDDLCQRPDLAYEPRRTERHLVTGSDELAATLGDPQHGTGSSVLRYALVCGKVPAR